MLQKGFQVSRVKMPAGDPNHGKDAVGWEEKCLGYVGKYHEGVWNVGGARGVQMVVLLFLLYEHVG